MILTGDIPIDERIIEFCRPALETGLPLLRVRTNSYDTATQLFQLSSAVPADDLERTRAAVEHVAQILEWLISQSKKDLEFRLSPAAFLHQLTEKARAAKKRIVLAEGSEPRTVKAAAICGRRGIARSVLLGKPSEVQAAAKSQDIELPDSLEILDPALIRENYVVGNPCNTNCRFFGIRSRDKFYVLIFEEGEPIIGSLPFCVPDSDISRPCPKFP